MLGLCSKQIGKGRGIIGRKREEEGHSRGERRIQLAALPQSSDKSCRDLQSSKYLTNPSHFPVSIKIQVKLKAKKETKREGFTLQQEESRPIMRKKIMQITDV